MQDRNMRSRITLAIVVIIAFNFNFVFGQSPINSPFSRYGIGILSTPTLGQSQAMGGVNIAQGSSLYLNALNPAANTSLNLQTFLFEVGANYKIDNFTSETENSTLNTAYLKHLTFGFKPHKLWGFSAGITPYSQVGYFIQSEQDLTDIGGSGTAQHIYEGNGGLNELFINNSFRVTEWLSLGVKTSYIFGNIENVSSTTNTAPNSYTEVAKVTSSRIQDWHLSYGMLLRKSFKDEKYRFSLGATFENKQNLDATNDFVISRIMTISGGTTTENIFSISNIDSSTVDLPQSINAGFMFTYDRRLTIGLDYTMQQWNETSFLGKSSDFVSNSSKVAFGIEFIPKNTPLSYHEIIRYRVGAHYSNSYIKIDGNQLNDFGVSIGAGFPMTTSRSVLNVSFEVGQYDSPDYPQLKNKYAVIGLNFSFQDIWFVKYKYD